jgi:hypothetical protein
MQMTPVTSSLIQSVGHNGLKMHVRFHNGALYEYDAVPVRVYREMIDAKSVGAFFGKHVKGRFEHKTVNGASR